jgi:hypothetical protein
MATHEEEPLIITTDPVEVRAVLDALHVMGALDDTEIYEILRPDGTIEQLQLGASFKHIADSIIQKAYPDCVVTLLSSGESPKL